MCPACMASAAVVVGSVTTTGGVTALVVKIFHPKIFRTKRGADESSENIKSKEKEQ